MKLYVNKILNILFFVLFCYVIMGCYATRTRKVPVYDTREIPYTERIKRTNKLPPIVPGDNHIIAFTRFAGGDDPTIEQVQENIKLGFQRQQSNDQNIVKNIKYISRAQLLRHLTRSELQEMGPRVEQILKDTFDVNIICTGTILSEAGNKLSIEVLDYRSNEIYNDVFEGSNWADVGSEVASAFFGTRIRVHYDEVRKYRSERYLKEYEYEKYKEYDPNATGWFLGGILSIALILILYN